MNWRNVNEPKGDSNHWTVSGLQVFRENLHLSPTLGGVYADLVKKNKNKKARRLIKNYKWKEVRRQDHQKQWVLIGNTKRGWCKKEGEVKKEWRKHEVVHSTVWMGGSIWKSLKERGGEREGEEEAKRAFGEYLGHSVRRVTSKNVLKI